MKGICSKKASFLVCISQTLTNKIFLKRLNFRKTFDAKTFYFFLACVIHFTSIEKFLSDHESSRFFAKKFLREEKLFEKKTLNFVNSETEKLT